MRPSFQEPDPGVGGAAACSWPTGPNSARVSARARPGNVGCVRAPETRPPWRASFLRQRPGHVGCVRAPETPPPWRASFLRQRPGRRGLRARPRDAARAHFAFVTAAAGSLGTELAGWAAGPRLFVSPPGADAGLRGVSGAPSLPCPPRLLPLRRAASVRGESAPGRPERGGGGGAPTRCWRIWALQNGPSSRLHLLVHPLVPGMTWKPGPRHAKPGH